MPIKSTQTNKYETACFIQEAPTFSEMDRGKLEIKKTTSGDPFCRFPATLQTYNCYNRMKRRYDMNNVKQVVNTDERIITLERQNKWRGEWNHPNPDIKGQQYSDIRMTIPEPTRCSHFINNHKFENDKMTAMITTHPKTESGAAVSSEIIDLFVVPSFSVRVLGNMIPNAPMNQPNMRVSKFITADMVDFPSHEGADADIPTHVLESYSEIIFLKQLANYCVEQSENLQVVCESFEITPDEITGINNGTIEINQKDFSRTYIPLKGDIRREAFAILCGRK